MQEVHRTLARQYGAELCYTPMLATLSKSNPKISRFIHSGVITDKNNQVRKDGRECTPVIWGQVYKASPCKMAVDDLSLKKMGFII